MTNVFFCVRHEAYFGESKYLTFCGLGDIIKGIVSCFLLCEKYGFNFYLNFSGSTLEKYVNTKFNQPIDTDQRIQFINSNLEEYLISNINSDIYLMTNVELDGVFDIEGDLKINLQNYIKDLFFSNQEILNFLKFKKIFNRNILHIRFGDTPMASSDFLENYYLKGAIPHPFNPHDWYNHFKFSDKLNLVLDSINKQSFDFDFVISDSLPVKDFFSSLWGVYCLDNKALHTGIETGCDSIFYTIVDFYTIFYGNSLVSYSAFPFGERKSAFSYIPSWFNNVKSSFFSLNFANQTCSPL